MIRDILSPEQLAAATAAAEAVLHIDVDWSGTARKSRAIIAGLREALAADDLLHRISLFRIDCGEQQGQLWIAFGNWLEAQSEDPLLRFHGNGGLIWMKGGTLTDTADYAASFAVSELVCRTRAVFCEQSGGSTRQLEVSRSQQVKLQRVRL